METTAALPGARPPTRAVGRIRRQSSFRALRQPEGRAARGPLRATFTGSPAERGEFPQVGYAISRRCGNAVTRNRLRRRLRAAVGETAAHQPPLPAGCYLIHTQPAAVDLDYRVLAEYVDEVLRAAAERRRTR